MSALLVGSEEDEASYADPHDSRPHSEEQHSSTASVLAHQSPEGVSHPGIHLSMGIFPQHEPRLGHVKGSGEESGKTARSAAAHSRLVAVQLPPVGQEGTPPHLPFEELVDRKLDEGKGNL